MLQVLLKTQNQVLNVLLQNKPRYYTFFSRPRPCTISSRPRTRPCMLSFRPRLRPCLFSCRPALSCWRLINGRIELFLFPSFILSIHVSKGKPLYQARKSSLVPLVWSSHQGIHKQMNAFWSIPRSQMSFWHFKNCRKWELWSLCCGLLLPASNNTAPVLNYQTRNNNNHHQGLKWFSVASASFSEKHPLKGSSCGKANGCIMLLFDFLIRKTFHRIWYFDVSTKYHSFST